MEFNRTKVYNFENAFHGMRNPLNSWNKGDSYFGLIYPDYEYFSESAFKVVDNWIEKENKVRLTHDKPPIHEDMDDQKFYYETMDNYVTWLFNRGVLSKNYDDINTVEVAFLGPNDLNLAQKLILAGNEHAKFMRQIFVSVDITAPLYWWKEADTYKVGTTANSTSTMHKLTSAPITEDFFEFDKNPKVEFMQNTIVDFCESLRQQFLNTGDNSYWRALVQMLPNAYLQTRTWTANYAILRNIYFQRKNHKLTEWHKFCDWVNTLPYSKELITLGEKDEIN